MNKINLTTVFIIIIFILAFLADRYHSNATEYKKQRDNKANELKISNATITGMTIRQRDAAALDVKYTGELADAKATIDQLERDVASGKRRLQINARCSDNGTTSAGGMGDATSPRLTNSAERDYFTLRERIETVTKQLTGLQAYVREQCLK
ncbi:MAG: lysis protein [Hafnia sp.]